MMLLKYLKKYLTKKVILSVLVPSALIAGAVYYLYFYREAENFSGASKEVTLFYLPGCIHCEQLKPVWERVANEFQGNVYLTVSEVNGKEDETTAKKYGVKAFPTIIYFESGKEMKTYEGDRSYESLKRFFQESIKM